MASTLIRSPERSIQAKINDFFFQPASARPLAALRISFCSVLILQALAIAPSLLDLFGPRGVTQWYYGELMIFEGVPRMSWLINLLAPLGISDLNVTRGVFVLYVAGLSALAFGWHSRIAAVVAYLTHLMLMMSNRSSLYGVDDFANIFLFYFMWMPVGHYWSMDVQEGRVSSAPSWDARLALRVLQLELCMVYLTSGIDKSFAPESQWWTGEVIWKAATLPDFRQFDMSWMADVPNFVRLITWGTLALELSYAFLIWPKKTRVLMALHTMAMHVGIAIMMGMISFGALMFVLTGSVWLFSPDPRDP